MKDIHTAIHQSINLSIYNQKAGINIRWNLPMRKKSFEVGRLIQPTNQIAVHCLIAVTNVRARPWAIMPHVINIQLLICLQYAFVPLDAGKRYTVGL